MEKCFENNWPIQSSNNRKSIFGSTYAWCIPTPEIMEYLTGLGLEFVEMGAGKGYLARELRNAGNTVHAYDISEFPEAEMWSPVMKGGPEKIDRHGPATALVLCYPPQVVMVGQGMDVDSVRRYTKISKGHDVIFMGEKLARSLQDIGSTGTVECWAELEANGYELVKELSCVKFPHIEDKMFHYKRK